MTNPWTDGLFSGNPFTHSLGDINAFFQVCIPERHICVQCEGSLGCNDGGVCDNKRNMCVQCLNTADCRDEGTICSTDQVCVECEEDRDCGTLHACYEGTCGKGRARTRLRTEIKVLLLQVSFR